MEKNDFLRLFNASFVVKRQVVLMQTVNLGTERVVMFFLSLHIYLDNCHFFNGLDFYILTREEACRNILI